MESHEAALAAVLNEAELAHAARYRFDDDRRRYVLGRGALRYLLADAAGGTPAGLQIEYGPHGKPYLAGGPAFNVSHTREHLVVAVSPHGEVGVDIEAVAGFPDLDQVARRYFSDAQYGEFTRLPPAVRARAFSRVWTVKEAVIKFAGLGLSAPHDAIRTLDFSIAPAAGQIIFRDIPPFWRVADGLFGCALKLPETICGCLVLYTPG